MFVSGGGKSTDFFIVFTTVWGNPVAFSFCVYKFVHTGYAAEVMTYHIRHENFFFFFF